MTRAEEKAMLLAVLGGLGAEESPSALRRFKQQMAGWTFGLVCAVAVLGTLIEPSIYKVLLAGICFAIGLGAGMSAWRLTAARQWPALAKVIDRAKVEARLRELDA